MYPQLAHRDESAWEKGEQAYELNDTLEMGPVKAAQYGYRAGCNGYAAFITAFSRRVRSKQVLGQNGDAGSATILTGDFQRSA